jgi:hypothetical protein
MLTAEQVMLRFRREVDDRLSDPDDLTDDADRLFTNDEIYEYIHEAQYETARATRGLLYVYTVPVVAGEPLVSVPGIIDVLDVELVSTRRALTERNRSEALVTTDDYGNVSTNVSRTAVGIPQHYTLDAVAGRMRLSPIPSADDSLEITMITLPRVAVTTGTDPTAFADPKDLRLVLMYMKYLAYDKQDTDTLDGRKSDDYRDEFEEQALKRESEISRTRRRPGVVAYGG